MDPRLQPSFSGTSAFGGSASSVQVGFLTLPCLPGHPLLAALLRVRLRGFKRSPFLPGHPHLAALPRV